MKSGYDIDGPYLTPDWPNRKMRVYSPPKSADRSRRALSGSPGQSLTYELGKCENIIFNRLTHNPHSASISKLEYFSAYPPHLELISTCKSTSSYHNRIITVFSGGCYNGCGSTFLIRQDFTGNLLFREPLLL